MTGVIAGVSGGVDSSVAVHLLKKQGYHVEAVIFKQVNAPSCDTDTMCCSASAIEEAKEVCRQLKIPLHIRDLREIFDKAVVQPTIKSFASGQTPSPCTTCNSKVRSVALNYIRQVLGFDYFATGHYFSVDNANGIVSRGKDSLKDQSYMVSLVDKKYFKYWLAPLGDYVKPEIRNIAADLGLITAQNPDSQDLCFKHLLPDFKRNVVINNSVIGSYNGRPTAGQKKGFYGLKVLAVDDNNIYLTKDSVEKSEVEIRNVNWLIDNAPNRASVQLRSHASVVDGTVVENKLLLDKPGLLTSGQVAAFYSDNRLLGGAVIV